jgi:hypothetical protein
MSSASHQRHFGNSPLTIVPPYNSDSGLSLSKPLIAFDILPGTIISGYLTLHNLPDLPFSSWKLIGGARRIAVSLLPLVLSPLRKQYVFDLRI